MIARSGRDWFGIPGFDPGAMRHGGFLYLLDDVGSTSDFLLGRGDAAQGRLCRWDGWGWQAGDRQPLSPPEHPRPGSMVAARRQGSGRGRQGRNWFSTGLCLSWTIDPVPRRHTARLAVWTGLMVVEALRELCGAPVQLKWPNDLYLENRKLGGMIFDLVQQGDERRLVAGLGVNVGSWPEGMPQELRSQAISLPHESVPSLGKLAEVVLARCDRELGHFVEHGWEPYHETFVSRDLLRDRRVMLSTPRGTMAGTARGIDENGALLLESSDGTLTTVLAGDVHIGDAGLNEGRKGP